MSNVPMRSNAHAMTSTQVAEELGVHVNTVKRIPPEDLPYFLVTRRGDRRFLAVDVARYIEERMVRATPAAAAGRGRLPETGRADVARSRTGHGLGEWASRPALGVPLGTARVRP